MVAGYAAMYLALGVIWTIFGAPAVFWFALGGLVMGVTALWEAGHKALAEEQSPLSQDSTQ